MTREWIDNDGRHMLDKENRDSEESLNKAYADYLKRRRVIDEAYVKSTEDLAKVPNAETVAAMKEAEAGNLKNFNNVQDLLQDLNTDDTPMDKAVKAGVQYYQLELAKDDLKGFDIRDNRPVSDPVVQRVMDKFRARHFQGMKTYGVTLEDNKASTLDWINHAQEEAMDFVLYLERLKVDVVPPGEYHLTATEQKIMDNALRRSIRPIDKG